MTIRRARVGPGRDKTVTKCTHDSLEKASLWTGTYHCFPSPHGAPSRRYAFVASRSPLRDGMPYALAGYAHPDFLACVKDSQGALRTRHQRNRERLPHKVSPHRESGAYGQHACARRGVGTADGAMAPADPYGRAAPARVAPPRGRGGGGGARARSSAPPSGSGEDLSVRRWRRAVPDRRHQYGQCQWADEHDSLGGGHLHPDGRRQ
jgi:hypothetical protein